MLLNIKTFHKEDIVFGGGLYCIIPKFAGKKKHTYIDHHQQRHQTTPHQTTQKQKNTQHQTKRHQTTHHRTTPTTQQTTQHQTTQKQKNTRHTHHTKYNEKMSSILKDHADHD